MNIDIDRLAEATYAWCDPEFIDDEAPVKAVHTMTGIIPVDELFAYVADNPDEFDYLADEDWDLSNLTDKQIKKIVREKIAME